MSFGSCTSGQDGASIGPSPLLKINKSPTAGIHIHLSLSLSPPPHTLYPCLPAYSLFSWPLQRPGSPQKTLPLYLTSQLPAHSHTPRDKQGQGGGTGLLISPMWSYQILLLLNSMLSLSLFLSNSTLWPLHNFFDEMDALIGCSPDEGTPLIVLGDFNNPPEKLLSPEFIDFFLTFDLILSHSRLDLPCLHLPTGTPPHLNLCKPIDWCYEQQRKN